LPKDKVFRLTAASIEVLHDIGIAFAWPEIEPVAAFDCLDLNLLESAAEQPFQCGFGVEFYPTLYDKAACLFFSIAGGHIFGNGNKRTAVLALDSFLTMNAVYLLLSNEEVRKLAEETATYRMRNENAKEAIAKISRLIARNSAAFRLLRLTNPSAYRTFHSAKNLIRQAASNQPDARPKQALRLGR